MCASVFTAGTFNLHMGNIASWCSLVDASWKPPLGKPLCSIGQSTDNVAMGSVSVMVALVRFVCLVLVRDAPKTSITFKVGVWALVGYCE